MITRLGLQQDGRTNPDDLTDSLFWFVEPAPDEVGAIGGGVGAGGGGGGGGGGGAGSSQWKRGSGKWARVSVTRMEAVFTT